MSDIGRAFGYASGASFVEPIRHPQTFLKYNWLNGKGQAVMSRAKVKKPPTHYLLVGSAVAGECFLDKDGDTIVLRLAKGTSLSWRDGKKLRLLPTRTTATVSRLPLQSVA